MKHIWNIDSTGKASNNPVNHSSQIRPRYLIVIDDIWTVSKWNSINCALPQTTKTGSRIIITTRLHEVAISCSNLPSDSVFVMKPLDEYESNELFRRRLGSEDIFYPEYCEVHDSMMKVCGGLPWTITILASTLAMTARTEWMMLRKSILKTETSFGEHQFPMNFEEISHESFSFKGRWNWRDSGILNVARTGQILITKGNKELVPNEANLGEILVRKGKKERVPNEAVTADISATKGKSGTHNEATIGEISVTKNIAPQRRNPLPEIRNILLVSYTKLPFPIKSCFVYLCVFPNNYVIDRDRLIWRWIAEGFIPRRPDEDHIWETGRNYFYELINRSLIEPVFADDGYEAEPVGCMVHGLVHDFIVSLSIEENFAMLDEHLESGPGDVIRRLSLNYTNQEESSIKLELDFCNMNLSQARTLTVLGRTQQMPHLSCFELLRVLDLEDAEGLQNSNLDHIGRLFNLIYLGVGGKDITELPKTIGELQLLETLEMKKTEVRKLPAAASQLQKLVRILAKALDEIPGGVDKMQDLQELSMVSVHSNHGLKFVAKLFKLKPLRILGVKWSFRDDRDDITGYRKGLISSLNKLSQSNINSLSIHSDEPSSLGFLADSVKYWYPPYKLQKLVMKGSSSYFSRVPKYLGKCIDLTFLEIPINLDSEEDFLIFANLPKLTILKLFSMGKRIIIRQGFKRLEAFWFQQCEAGLQLVFEDGTMSLLLKLCLHFKVVSQLQQLEEKQGCFVSGLQRLSSLEQVNVKIDCDGATPKEVASVEEAIKKDKHVDGKKFKFELSRDNEEKMKRTGGQGSNTPEEIN